MNVNQRRRTFTSRRRATRVPINWWQLIFLAAIMLVIILAWIRGGDDADDTTIHIRRSSTQPVNQHQQDLEHNHMMALEIDLDDETTITVRVSVMSLQCPKAYEFLTWMIDNQTTECKPCTIYRGEPVPSYWGSTDYPDRWDNGGRWGPPYALVQGGFPNAVVSHIEREAHRPEVKRGMVAWAGPRGVHFFIALADHPEWKNEHTVWGEVVEEDITLVDSLVDGSRSLKVNEKNVPVVTNFVDPMPFRIREIREQ